MIFSKLLNRNHGSYKRVASLCPIWGRPIWPVNPTHCPLDRKTRFRNSPE